MATDGDFLVLMAGVSIILICLGLAISGGGTRSRTPLARRAEAICRRVRHTPIAGESRAAPSVRRDSTDHGAPGFDRLVRRFLPRQAALRRRLAQTGRQIGLGSYAAIGLLLATVTAGILLMIARQPMPLAIALSVLIGVGAPHLAINRMIRKRLEQFAAVFPDAIDLIVRGVKSGLPVIESVAAVGREMADPVGVEFRRIADNVRFGQSLEDAMWETAGRLDTPEFRFFVISLAVQRETGGNLAETLGNLSDILRRRRQMRLKIKAMSSEARASAMILGSLPFVLFAIIFLMNPEYETMLFTDPRGRMALIAGLVIMAIGIGIMRKMVRFAI